jgi:hypothetical protein
MSDWLTGTGYIRLWERLHRAEEALLIEAPLGRVLAEANADVHRVTGSTMENSDALLVDARAAIAVLTAVAGMAVNPPPPPPPPAPPQYSAADEEFARETLRQFRRAINEFRDDARMGLVRARNHLLRTVFVTTMVSYVLLALAILAGAPTRAIFAAGCFFLIGALVGLFNRLYLDAATNSAVEDYGLTAARVLHTPIISGLAAVGAVLIIPMLSVVLSPENTTNGGPNEAARDARAAVDIPPLLDLFNIDRRPFGLVLAAIFGLSPAALISRLQQESEQYKTGLKSSQAPSAQN